VVKNLPIDKSLGPDGFNTDFIKSVGPWSSNISMIFVLPFTQETFVCRA
jgi:hypothetical protein